MVFLNTKDDNNENELEHFQGEFTVSLVTGELQTVINRQLGKVSGDIIGIYKRDRRVVAIYYHPASKSYTAFSPYSMSLGVLKIVVQILEKPEEFIADIKKKMQEQETANEKENKP